MDSALSDYKSMSDEQLVRSAKNDKKAVSELIVRYLRIVHFLAGRYSAGIYEDLVQEGFMGLLKAVNTYRPDENVKFSTYANVCVKNRIISSLKRNSLINGEEFTEEIVQSMFENQMAADPEKIVIENESMDEVYKKITSALSEQEWRVFQLFLTGMAYNQMALNLGVSVKSIDNAMQRVRRKLKSVLK
ncbi:MAG: sigma-70 family RNA polymerase sigma factor [Ruminococcus sp.]|nr:sigma-70 family RNA polymerase sigma factor [Ruminococcus sp.]